MLSNWLFCFLFRVLHRHCAENAICHTVRSEQNWLLERLHRWIKRTRGRSIIAVFKAQSCIGART